MERWKEPTKWQAKIKTNKRKRNTKKNPRPEGNE
jgi:hypothetical protein